MRQSTRPLLAKRGAVVEVDRGADDEAAHQPVPHHPAAGREDRRFDRLAADTSVWSRMLFEVAGSGVPPAPWTMHFGTPVVPEEYMMYRGWLKGIGRHSGSASGTRKRCHSTMPRIPPGVELTPRERERRPSSRCCRYAGERRVPRPANRIACRCRNSRPRK